MERVAGGTVYGGAVAGANLATGMRRVGPHAVVPDTADWTLDTPVLTTVVRLTLSAP
jgi:hypothetical protein